MGEEGVLVRAMRIKECAEKLWVTLVPVGAHGVAPQPAFLLQKMEEDEATEKFFNEVTHGLERAVLLLCIQPPEGDAENPRGCVGRGQIIAERLVVLLAPETKLEGGRSFFAM